MEDEELRFEFGENWQEYVDHHLSEERAAQAVESLAQFLGSRDLRGRTFIDIGCGSGLFSNAAFELGAAEVFSFDYDPMSVRCCEQLRERAGNPSNWTVLQGSILDREFVSTLKPYDIVYSWGVLHHTGDMWPAIRNAAGLVAPNGHFLIAIYNKFGNRRGSRLWVRIKRLYNRAPLVGKKALEYADICRRIVGMLIRFQNPVKEIRDYGSARGMSWRTDLVDWLGGYPYEFATVEEIFRFCRDEFGFQLVNLRQDSGLGCNEFLFRRGEKEGGIAAGQRASVSARAGAAD